MSSFTNDEKMAEVACPCGGTKTEVVRVTPTSYTRTGWYCAACREFKKAVGRERVIEVR